MKHILYFRIADIPISVISEEKLNPPKSFLPFTSSPDEPKIVFEVRFENKPLDPEWKCLYGNVYLHNNKKYTVYHSENGDVHIKEENAEDNGKYILYLPPHYRDYFKENGKWLRYFSVEQALSLFDRVSVHASGVIYKGEAYLFSAPSGTGKSTQATLWIEHLGAEIINGDKIILGTDNGILTAYGGPSSGTSGIYKNISAPVKCIFMIAQGSQNIISPLSPSQRLISLYSECVKSEFDEAYNLRVIKTAQKAIDLTHICSFSCLPEVSAAEYAVEYTKKEQ